MLHTYFGREGALHRLLVLRVDAPGEEVQQELQQFLGRQMEWKVVNATKRRRPPVALP